MVKETDELTPIKRQAGVPDSLVSCHTGMVKGYAVEGHVPADLIKKLLAERPAVAGLAVPGMPKGAPGMEMGGQKDSYRVLTFTKDGKTAVYAER